MQPSRGRLWIDYAWKPGQREGAARRLFVSGLGAPPSVVCNGRELKGPLPKARDGDRDAFEVPLDDDAGR